MWGGRKRNNFGFPESLNKHSLQQRTPLNTFCLCWNISLWHWLSWLLLWNRTTFLPPNSTLFFTDLYFLFLLEHHSDNDFLDCHCVIGPFFGPQLHLFLYWSVLSSATRLLFFRCTRIVFYFSHINSCVLSKWGNDHRNEKFFMYYLPENMSYSLSRLNLHLEIILA